MSERSSRFDAPRALDGLSAEARQLVLEARERLEDWIDANVDRIESTMRASIEARRRELAAHAAGIRSELAAGRESMTEILERLVALQDGFEAGDGIAVDEAVRATRDVVRDARRAFEERERRLSAAVREILSQSLDDLEDV